MAVFILASTRGEYVNITLREVDQNNFDEIISLRKDLIVYGEKEK